MALSNDTDDMWPHRAQALPILLSLASLATVAWIVTIAHMRAPEALMKWGVPMAFGMDSRPSVGAFVIFLMVWLIMMVAMMFPSVWPVVLLYTTVARKRGNSAAIVPFVAGYVLVWEACGLLVYGGSIGANVLSTIHPDLPRTLPLVGIVVAATGLYQFTPLKRRCLTHCQSPLSFLMTQWRNRRGGALRMGLWHGTYCLGCCSGLMLTLVALGAMDVRWMATVGAVIAVEKLGPRHPAIPWAVGLGLVILGVAVTVWPTTRMAM